MARGFLSGAIWGAVISVMGAGAVSLLSEPPVPEVVANAPATPDVAPNAQVGPTGSDAAVGETADTVDPADPASEQAIAQVGGATEQGTDGGADAPRDQGTDERADKSAQDPAGLAPEAQTEGPTESIAPKTPLSETAPSDAAPAPATANIQLPQVPDQPDGTDASTDKGTASNAGLQPDTDLPIIALDLPDLVPAPGDDTPSTPTTDQSPAAAPATIAPVVDPTGRSDQTAQTDTAPKAPGALAGIRVEPAPDPAVQPATDAAPLPETSPAPEPQIATDSDQTADPSATPDPAPRDPSSGQAPQVAVLIPEPAQPVPPAKAPADSGLDRATTQNPAPETGGDTADPAPADPAAPTVLTQTARAPIGKPAGNLIETRRAEAEQAAANAPDTAQQPPLQAFAAPFENPMDKPVMSIILMDDPTGALGPDVLFDFPYPVSIALDALAPGATARMQAYRAAGFEVLAMAGVPQGAQPSDVEVTLQAVFSALPETVALLEAPGASLQQDRAISAQVTDALLANGRGWVSQAKGLNTAQKIALKEGVPAASIFRDIDGAGQNAEVIRRFLDNAAFRARQEEGGIVVLCRLRPETLSALLLWGLQDRAAQVALAPTSALLTATIAP